MGFKPVMAESDLWAGEMAAVRVGDVKLLLLRDQDSVRAFENRCPHQAVELSDGACTGDKLVCPAHGWVFSATTGCGLNPKGVALRSFPVRIEQGAIMVDVGDTPWGRETLVGPILASGEVAAAIAAAASALNPHVAVTDEGAYVRVFAPGRCHVTRQMIERQLGRPLELRASLEAIMVSFRGRLALSRDEVLWTSGS